MLLSRKGLGTFPRKVLECVFDVMCADFGSVGQDPDHVEAQSVLLVGGNGLERVTEAGPAPQLDFDEDDGVVPAHYQVDLPAPGPVVALDELVTVPGQVAQREVLTPCSGGLVFQSPTPA